MNIVFYIFCPQEVRVFRHKFFCLVYLVIFFVVTEASDFTAVIFPLQELLQNSNMMVILMSCYSDGFLMEPMDVRAIIKSIEILAE